MRSVKKPARRAAIPKAFRSPPRESALLRLCEAIAATEDHESTLLDYLLANAEAYVENRLIAQGMPATGPRTEWQVTAIADAVRLHRVTLIQCAEYFTLKKRRAADRHEPIAVGLVFHHFLETKRRDPTSPDDVLFARVADAMGPGIAHDDIRRLVEHCQQVSTKIDNAAETTALGAGHKGLFDAYIGAMRDLTIEHFWTWSKTPHRPLH